MKHFKKLLMSVALAAMLAVPKLHADCNYGTYALGQDSNNNHRKLTYFELMTDDSNVQRYDVNQIDITGSSVVYDLSNDPALSVPAGATVKFKSLLWTGEWMHGYLYVDYNGDGSFDSKLNAIGEDPLDGGGELVSYSFYGNGKDDGTNSAGQSVNKSVGLGNGNATTGAQKMPSFVIPETLTPGKYNCLFKIDWDNLTECGDQVAKSCGCVVRFCIDVTGTAERVVSVESNNPEYGTVSIKGHEENSVEVAGAVTVVAKPTPGHSFENWTNKNGGAVLGSGLQYIYSGNDPINIVGNFVDLFYPTMTRTYTNTAQDPGQDNRYVKKITTTGTHTPTVFDCNSQEELPYTKFTASPNASMQEGANIPKLDNPIKVDYGTTQFEITYLAWTTPINSRNSQLNWTQEAYYVDWDCDGRFESEGEVSEKGITSMGNDNPITTSGLTRVVRIPADQAPGKYRMRVVFYEPETDTNEWQKTLFTVGGGEIRNGVSYDLEIEIAEPMPMTIAEATAKSLPGTAKTGDRNVAIASLSITTSGSVNPKALDKITISYAGDNIADISNLRLVYSTTSETGSDVIAYLDKAAESMEFTTNKTLAVGSNNFVLLADVAEDATPDNTIKVTFDNITIDGENQEFTQTGTGGLTVVYDIDYTLGNAIWFDSPNPDSYKTVWKTYPNNYNTTDNNPDQNWERKSFPIGNGSFGGNVLGVIANERIVLNEKTLWKGGPGTGATSYWNMNRTVDPSILQDIRTKLEAGDNDGADRLVHNSFYGNTDYRNSSFGSYTTMGEAYVATGISTTGVTNYKRILNMDKSIAVVQFTQGGVDYTRKYFASYPDNVQVWNFTSEGGTQDLTFSFACAQTVNSVEKVGNDGLLYRCSVSGNNMQWAFRVYARVNDGKGTVTVNLNSASSTIRVSGSANVEFILAADTDYAMNFDPDFTSNTTYVGEDPVENVNKWVDEAKEYTYSELYQRHYDDYSKLYGRTTLKINPDKIFSNVPTPRRLANYSASNLDNELEEQYFQFGRYLLISSSREGNMPANLQGMWHNHTDGAWRVDYHNNVNLQMNYWPATSTNLLECFTPLVDYVRGLVKPGERTAQAYYGASGWTTEVSTNIFGFTAPLSDKDYSSSYKAMTWNYNPTAGPWLATQLWDYYDYTRDDKWLREVGYDIIKGAANFSYDILYKVGDYYTSAPSYSPEHGDVDLGATYANAVTREILKDAIQAANILEQDSELVAKWQDRLDNMYPYKIGQHGQLQEWYKDIDPAPGVEAAPHRHTNHLFGLHPGTTINAVTDTVLANACKQTLFQRGDEATGWSMGWKLNHWARLLDGDHAYTLFQNLLMKGTADNMWDLHPPFQIDGNFGGTAGIAEMFLQSHNGFLHLLPALPSAWKNGHITGLLGRGNFEVDIYYNNNELEYAKIRSNKGEKCTVYYKGKQMEFDTYVGGEYTITTDDEGELQVDGLDTVITIETASVTTSPEENPTQATVCAGGVSVVNQNGGTLTVSYKLNDDEETTAMAYDSSSDIYTATIDFEDLESGEYTVTVVAVVTDGEEETASEEKEAGSFTVPERPVVVTIGSASVETTPADEPTQATVYAEDVVAANMKSGTLTVSYKLNDNDETTAMAYDDSAERYAATIIFDDLEPGEYTVTVVAAVTDDEEEIASEEKEAGKFTVPERPVVVTIGSASVETSPADEPTQATVYAEDVVATNMKSGTLSVGYKLNDSDETTAMAYDDSAERYAATISFDDLKPGDYDVTVVAVVTDGDEEIASEEKSAGSFTVKEIDAIVDVEADIAGGARYFNMQGIEVTNPLPGLYIRVANDTAAKVYVK